MTDLKLLKEQAGHALCVAMLAHAAPQSGAFRKKALNEAVDSIAEYACQHLRVHYKLDTLPKKP